MVEHHSSKMSILVRFQKRIKRNIKVAVSILTYKNVTLKKSFKRIPHIKIIITTKNIEI